MCDSTANFLRLVVIQACILLLNPEKGGWSVLQIRVGGGHIVPFPCQIAMRTVFANFVVTTQEIDIQ